jgi:hypothetical protein
MMFCHHDKAVEAVGDRDLSLLTQLQINNTNIKEKN